MPWRFSKRLERRERRRLVSLIPLMLLAAAVEVGGVAAVFPFLSVLANPEPLPALPLIGPLVAASGVDDVGVLVRLTGLLLAAVILVANLVMILKQYWLVRFSWSLNHSLSSRLLCHYLRQAYVFTLTHNTAALTNKLIVEVRQVVGLGLRSAMEIVVRAAIVVALVGFLVVLDPQMARVVFIALGLVYWGIYQVSKGILYRLGRESVVAGASRVKAINEALGGFKELKVAGREASALRAETSIELRGVRFSYPATDHPVLANVDIEVLRGRSLAFDGRTGSGKTTLVDVVLGLLEPDAGELLVDGVPVAPDQRRAYRRLFGYVPQSIFLTDDTIARNVAFGMVEAEIDHDAVRRACQLAQIADFVEGELPDGYATVVGERGVRLSGGQRQRIGIARALYHRPQVLVFDEATSALDVHTERHVYDALAALAKTHTIVTVAHRLETVTHSDRVIVLEQGRIVDQGQPDEVLGRYREGSLTA